MNEPMNIKELAARVLAADRSALVDAIGEVAETKRILEAIRDGAPTVEKRRNPIEVIQGLGYVFEARDKKETVLVRRVYGEKNPYYIARQSVLRVCAVGGGHYVARFDVDGHRAYSLDLMCGYSRALSMAVRAVIGWHRISSKSRGKKGGAE